MTKREFDMVVRRALIAMYVHEDVADEEMLTSWNKEYEHVKALTLEQFKLLCAQGVAEYKKAMNASSN